MKEKAVVSDIEACLMFFEIERLIKKNGESKRTAEDWRNKFINLQGQHKREVDDLQAIINQSKYQDTSNLRNSSYQTSRIKQLEDKITLLSSENQRLVEVQQDH